MFDFFTKKKKKATAMPEPILNESYYPVDGELNYEAADAKFEKALMDLRMGGRKVPKLNKEERELLEFCDARNMTEFLREEFDKHPIILNEDGELVGENPFEKERREQRELLEQRSY